MAFSGKVDDPKNESEFDNALEILSIESMKILDTKRKTKCSCLFSLSISMAEAGLEVKNFKVKDAGLEGKNIMVMDDGLEGKNTKVKADVIKEEHLRLAGIIKGVHADLRKKYQTNSHDFETVWKEHCTNQSVLSEYADAMYHLAHDHWSQLPKTRIDWCRDTIVEYFCHDGMTKAVEKEQRRQKHMTQKLHISTTCSFSEETGDFSRLESKASTEQRSCCSEDKPIFVTLPIEGKIRILDVGSCFNPFGDYKDFLAVGIDISPANPSVQFCDFLHVETTRPLQVACDTLETYLKNLKSPVDKLPKCSFHVVVFSLLLEYFPSPYQRWICCQKAYELLMVNGLLLIVTPDSHKQHRNAPMIKSWKKAIEEIGFIRWRYIKLEHLHCMAFRKIQKEEETSLFVSEITPDMLYIPQDFHDSVQFCDFLHVETTRPLQVACDTLETYLKNLKSPVDKLPKCSFHVVVFSLLLEYFPSPYQRWICCQKAYELLMVNGLLLIVTPDSHKQHRNAPMIKSWKKAIEEIGFIRWRYIKLEHLHCMAFRKIQKEEETSLFVSEITPDMLYIPQDFHDVDEMESVFSCQYTEDDEKFFMESVGELPGFVDTDE